MITRPIPAPFQKHSTLLECKIDGRIWPTELAKSGPAKGVNMSWCYAMGLRQDCYRGGLAGYV